jgi:putative inorganic carbon (HCO3(-)) transporter
MNAAPQPPIVRPPLAARRVAVQPTEPTDGLAFVLFLLTNMILFVRPGDIFSALTGYEFYRYFILACAVIGLPSILTYFSSNDLSRCPIDVCVLLLLPIIFLSGVVSVGIEHALDSANQYFKLQVYYFVLVSLVITPKRLRLFTSCLILFTTVVIVLSMLDFFEISKLPRMIRPDGTVGAIEKDRMYGPGIFQDPNDVCILIVANLMLLLGRVCDTRQGASRFLWSIPLVIFATGFLLTQSRGGLLALLAGLAILIRLRFGWRGLITLGSLGFPLLLLMVGARQATLSTSAETARDRIYLWYDGLQMFRNSPLFGVGLNQFTQYARLVAHSSYVQSFAELGFFGGMLFLGAQFLAISGLYRLGTPATVAGRSVPRVIADPVLHQMFPYLAGAVMAHAVGMVSLTLHTSAITFTMLGLASLFIRMAKPEPPAPQKTVDLVLFAQLFGLAVCFIIGLSIFIRLSI